MFNQIEKGMKKKILLLWCFALMAVASVFAQAEAVTGRVLVEGTDEPVVGATVVVLGTSQGTVSDSEGKFSLNAPKNATLIVSYVGMKTVQVPASDNVIVHLAEDTEMLDDVVVTALAMTRSERSLGYSATKVNADDIVSSRQTNVANSIAGKVAGVQVLSTSTDPGANSYVIIRGFSSINGSNQPLYVVDGIPLANYSDTNGEKNTSLGGISNISPKDIESMTILKGAAATALYGSRAANGVVVITTKQGKKGQKHNFNIEYSGGVTFSQVANFPAMQNEFGQGWNGQQTFIENGSWGPRLDGSTQVYGPIWNNSQLIHEYSAKKTNVKDFFDIGVSHNHSISFSGASDNNKMTYFASYSFTGDNGIMPGNKDTYQRHTLAFRGSYEPVKWLKVSSTINFATSKADVVYTEQGTSMIDGLYEMARDVSIVDMKDLSSAFNTPEAYYTPYGITNPYWSLENNYRHNDAKQVFGKVQVDVKPIKDLTITYRLGIDYQDSDRKIGYPEIKLDDALIQNDFGYAPSNMNQAGNVWTAYNRNYELNHDFLANYGHVWGDWDFNVVVGLNINQRGGTAMSGQTDGLTFETGFWQLSNGATRTALRESQSKRRLIGLFGEATLGWREMLYLDLTARNDWSSTLPIEKNSYFYPGATLSWVFSQLIPKNKALEFGKVRVAYGMTGNDADVYLTNPTFLQAYANGYYYGDMIKFPVNGTNAFFSDYTLGSANLKPEMTSEAEVGLDLRFLGGRIGLDATYYHRITKDQIFTLPVDPATGYQNMVTNFGKVRNQGVELELKTTPVKTKHVRWDLDFNFALNRNKVLSLPAELQDENGEAKSTIARFSAGNDAVYVYAMEGKPMGQFYTYLPQRTEDGKLIVDANGQPVLSTEVEDTGKNMQSDWTGGISTALSFYGVTLSAVLDVRMGGYMFSRTKNLMQFTGNGEATLYNDRQPFIIPNSVVDNGDGTYSPNTTPIYLYNQSYQNYFNNYGAAEGGEFYLLNRSFAKLRNISLTWELPRKWVDAMHLENFSITAYVNNVYTWTHKSNRYIDPETTSYAADGDLAAQFGELYSNPSSRTYGLNLNVKF